MKMKQKSKQGVEIKMKHVLYYTASGVRVERDDRDKIKENL